MDAAELDAFIDEATALTRERNAEVARDYGLGTHARYDLDLSAGRLTFRGPEGEDVVTARVVAVGSWAEEAGSWLWSWENDSIPRDESADMQAVRVFGATHDVAALRGSFSPCDEALAWALAAISLKLLDARAVYRVPQAKNLLFLLLFDLERKMGNL